MRLSDGRLKIQAQLDRFTIFSSSVSEFNVYVLYFFVVLLILDPSKALSTSNNIIKMRREIRNFDLLEQKELQKYFQDSEWSALFFFGFHIEKGELLYLNSVYWKNKNGFPFFLANLKVVCITKFILNLISSARLWSFTQISCKKKTKNHNDFDKNSTYSSIAWYKGSSVGAFS